MERLRAVDDLLQRYADRGVFRGFGRRPLAGGCVEYRFSWHGPRAHLLVVDSRRRTASLRGLLPEVPYRSAMEVALRRFLESRAAAGVPEHRRIDPRRARVRARNRAGTVSIELLAAPGELAYAVEKSVKLLNEIFLSFLAGPYDDYMVRVFDAPEE
jgi:hypothetical protein